MKALAQTVQQIFRLRHGLRHRCPRSSRPNSKAENTFARESARPLSGSQHKEEICQMEKWIIHTSMRKRNTMTTKIDNLRAMVAHIGTVQTEYHQFFPSFADRLEKELGVYLGTEEHVALCCAIGPFDFENGNYNHAGLGFEGGKYRIPLMVRLKNLNDDGDTLVRVRLYFMKAGENLTAQVEEKPPINVSIADLTLLCECIYAHLTSMFSEAEWFKQDRANYQNTTIGFA
jgi:hypothetical protein